jgi:hypothetical protein
VQYELVPGSIEFWNQVADVQREAEITISAAAAAPLFVLNCRGMLTDDFGSIGAGAGAGAAGDSFTGASSTLIGVPVGLLLERAPCTLEVWCAQMAATASKTNLADLADLATLAELDDVVFFVDTVLSSLSQVARDVSAALAACRRLSLPIVHQDVKSSNVFVWTTGTTGTTGTTAITKAKLGDFGSATRLGRGFVAPAGNGLTRAPETARGVVIPASDVYALGVVLASAVFTIFGHWNSSHADDGAPAPAPLWDSAHVVQQSLSLLGTMKSHFLAAPLAWVIAGCTGATPLGRMTVDEVRCVWTPAVMEFYVTHARLKGDSSGTNTNDWAWFAGVCEGLDAQCNTLASLHADARRSLVADVVCGLLAAFRSLWREVTDASSVLECLGQGENMCSLAEKLMHVCGQESAMPHTVESFWLFLLAVLDCAPSAPPGAPVLFQKFFDHTVHTQHVRWDHPGFLTAGAMCTVLGMQSTLPWQYLDQIVVILGACQLQVFVQETGLHSIARVLSMVRDHEREGSSTVSLTLKAVTTATRQALDCSWRCDAIVEAAIRIQSELTGFRERGYPLCVASLLSLNVALTRLSGQAD